MASHKGEHQLHLFDIEMRHFRVTVTLDAMDPKRPSAEQLALKLADGPWHMEGVRKVEVEPIV